MCLYLRPARNCIPNNYKYVISLLIILNQDLSVIQTLLLLNSVPWVATKAVGPVKRTRVPGDKDHHTLLEPMEARGRETREFLIPHPLIVNVWQIYGVPRWPQLKAVSDSLNIIINKACKGTIDLVIRWKADEETSVFSYDMFLLREICSWDIGFARRAVSMSLKAKPIGDMKTGPTGMCIIGFSTQACY